MSTVDIIDLDIVTTVDRKVKLGGVVYRVPGELPVGWLIDFRALQAALSAPDADEFAVFEQLRDMIADLFAIRQADLDMDAVVTALDGKSLGELMGTVSQIYGNPEAAQAEGSGEGEAPARPKRAAGTRSTSPRRTTKSRSRSSS